MLIHAFFWTLLICIPLQLGLLFRVKLKKKKRITVELGFME